MFNALPKSCAPSLYLVHSYGITKIGNTVKPRYRFRHLHYEFMDRTGSPLSKVAFYEGIGGTQLEALAIKHLSQTFPLFRGREYFRCDFSDAMREIEHLGCLKPTFYTGAYQ